MILAALVILSMAARVRSLDQVTCLQPILCPCGSTGKYVKACAEEDNPCFRWSNCKTCQDGVDGCLDCPEGSKGLSCSKKPEKLSRQRRQYFTYGNYQNWGIQRGCPELRSPKLGSIRCIYNERQRTCTGKCLPGYSYEGHGSETEMTLTCTSDYFTPLREFPPCKSGGHCDLVVQSAGSFNCTTGMSGTRCDVVCSGRFVGRYSCFPGQSWQPTLPYCVRPKEIPLAPRSCECQNGGRCKDDGGCECTAGWSGRLCDRRARRARNCPDPGFIENGVRQTTRFLSGRSPRYFTPGETVSYNCDSEQYVLQGSFVLTCQSDGTWSDTAPKCVVVATTRPPPSIVYCRDPGVDSNGSRNPSSTPSYRGFQQGASVEYFCNDGYILEGTSVIFCSTTGRWSAGRPRCKIQPPPQNYCQDPGIDSNGGRNLQSSPSPQGFLEGSRLEYFCNEGYDIEGERMIMCMASGRWSSQRPTCRHKPEPVIQTCLNPGTVSNGRIVYYAPQDRGTRRRPSRRVDPQIPEGGFLLYSCNSGFDLMGSDSLYCEKNGKWSSDPPICVNDETRADCLNPGPIENGRIVYYPPLVSGRSRLPNDVQDQSEYTTGGLLLYYCNSGYSLHGSGSLTCEENGEWSAEPPTCRRDTNLIGFCPDPGVDPNGSRYSRERPTRRGFPHGTQLEYSCNEGYELDGERVLFCLSSSDWLSDRPRCKQKGPEIGFCPNPGSFSNGLVVYHPAVGIARWIDVNEDNDGFPEGERLQYICNTGYTLEGRESLICQHDGRWSAQLPVCAKATPEIIGNSCENPGPIPNGRVDYVPSPNGRRPRPGANGEIVDYPQGSRLVYSCDIGYTVHGESEITCLETGLWSAVLPICLTSVITNMLYCRKPGPLMNGKFRYYPFNAGPRSGSRNLVSEDTPEYPEGSILEYQCDDGYNLEGTVSVMCLSTGLWSAPTPQCTLDCGRIAAGVNPKILHGTKVKAGEWPWVVAIAIQENSLPFIVCGGAVLNTRTVITAAHCLDKDENYTLYFGKLHRNNALDDDLVQVARSETVIIHPEYNEATFDSDIALIIFEPKIRFSPRVQPICLPTGITTMWNLDVGKKGYVTGWGENEKQVGSEDLMMAHLPFQTNENCTESFRIYNVNNLAPNLTQNMFCAGFPQAEQSTCRGDSGSPFVFYDPNTERHTIEGIVSFTVEGECGLEGIYSVYTKVQKFLPWIYRNME